MNVPSFRDQGLGDVAVEGPCTSCLKSPWQCTLSKLCLLILGVKELPGAHKTGLTSLSLQESLQELYPVLDLFATCPEVAWAHKDFLHS